MKKIFSITRKILILFIILFTPIGLLVAISYLSYNGIPLWNIGIRNVLSVLLNHILPIFFIDYIISTTIVVSFTDKMLLKPIIVVHTGALIPAIIVLSVYYAMIERNYPVRIKGRKIYTGYLTYLKPGSFNNFDQKTLLLQKKTHKKFDAYILDKRNGKLTVFKDIKPSYKIELGTFYLDNSRNVMVFYSKSGKRIIKEEIQLKIKDSVNTLKNPVPSNKIISRIFIPAYSSLRSRVSSFTSRNKVIFMAALTFTIIFFVIPLCYLMNDTMWGLSGFTGTALSLILIPVFLLGCEKFIDKIRVNMLGSYEFLFVAVIIFIPGLILNAVIGISGIRK